jgi:hypothetical protein
MVWFAVRNRVTFFAQEDDDDMKQAIRLSLESYLEELRTRNQVCEEETQRIIDQIIAESERSASPSSAPSATTSAVPFPPLCAQLSPLSASDAEVELEIKSFTKLEKQD